MNAFCTVITANYAPYAMALYKSYTRFLDIPLEVLVVDSSDLPLKSDGSEDRIRFTRLSQQRFDDTGGAIVEKYRNHADVLRWSLKSVWLHYLLEKKGYENVVFLDPDLFFFADPSFVFEKLRGFQMLLSPHWRSFDPSIDPVNFELTFCDGLYNGGFIGATSRGKSVLKWLSNACLYACEPSRTRGLFVDQKYLDVLPVQFNDIGILQHKGCNVANWNQIECKRIMVGDQILINGQYPLIFVHFTRSTIRGITQGTDGLLTPYLVEYIDALRAENVLIELPPRKGVQTRTRRDRFMHKVSAKLFLRKARRPE